MNKVKKSILTNIGILGPMIILMLSIAHGQIQKDIPIYSDISNPKACLLRIKLAVSGIKSPILQWAVVDFDPVPGYQKQLSYLKYWYPNWIAGAKDEKEKIDKRNFIMTCNWEDGFQYVKGNELYVYSEGSDDNGLNANWEGKRWLITKILEKSKENLCWSIPLDFAPGKKIDVKLTKANALNLNSIFDEIMTQPTTISLAVKPNPYHDTMLATLHNAQTLYYETEVRHSVPDLPVCTLKVWLKKPNYARIEFAPKGELSCVLVGDGENFWIYWPKHRPRFSRETDAEYELTKNKRYLRLDATPHMHSLWHIIAKFGIGLTAFQPSYFLDCPFGVDQTIDSIISLGDDKIAGYDEPFDYIEVSLMNHQRSRFYWLSKKDHLPRKVKDVIRVKDENYNEENWMNVSLNQNIPDSLFKWQPPAGWTEYIEPTLGAGLLKIGDPAPNFRFKTLDGKDFFLSAQKGKIVLLNIWRVGCPPCREELPWLEKMFLKFKDKGLVVVGLNVSDNEKYVRELLDTNDVTYPNILDQSEAAKQLVFNRYQKYGMSAVPLNYLIDKEGKVSAAWYGYGDPQDCEIKISRLLE